MKLHIISSSSSGNCYVLESNNGNKLIIEAGVSFKSVKESLNFNISKIEGVIISHEHL